MNLMKIPRSKQHRQNVIKRNKSDEEEQDRLERRERREFLAKVREQVQSRSKSLIAQIKSGNSNPTVILPGRGTELAETVGKKLQEIFERKGYRCNYDTTHADKTANGQI
jgi:hypothetical protein